MPAEPLSRTDSAASGPPAQNTMDTSRVESRLQTRELFQTAVKPLFQHEHQLILAIDHHIRHMVQGWQFPIIRRYCQINHTVNEIIMHRHRDMRKRVKEAWQQVWTEYDSLPGRGDVPRMRSGNKGKVKPGSQGRTHGSTTHPWSYAVRLFSFISHSCVTAPLYAHEHTPNPRPVPPLILGLNQSQIRRLQNEYRCSAFRYLLLKTLQELSVDASIADHLWAAVLTADELSLKDPLTDARYNRAVVVLGDRQLGYGHQSLPESTPTYLIRSLHALRDELHVHESCRRFQIRMKHRRLRCTFSLWASVTPQA